MSLRRRYVGLSAIAFAACVALVGCSAFAGIFGDSAEDTPPAPDASADVAVALDEGGEPTVGTDGGGGDDGLSDASAALDGFMPREGGASVCALGQADLDGGKLVFCADFDDVATVETGWTKLTGAVTFDNASPHSLPFNAKASVVSPATNAWLDFELTSVPVFAPTRATAFFTWRTDIPSNGAGVDAWTTFSLRNNGAPLVDFGWTDFGWAITSATSTVSLVPQPTAGMNYDVIVTAEAGTGHIEILVNNTVAAKINGVDFSFGALGIAAGIESKSTKSKTVHFDNIGLITH